MIRPFNLDKDAAAAQRLHALCHPSWPDRDSQWWFAHPTLMLEEAGAVIGMTSFSLSFPPTPELAQSVQKAGSGEVCYGHGVWVDPDERHKGYGDALADARHAYAHGLGARFFIGMTWKGNTSMRRIFNRQALVQQAATVPNAYPTHKGVDRTGLLYVGVILSGEIV
jgi:GNAT superfamily N-acetyltransferase